MPALSGIRQNAILNMNQLTASLNGIKTSYATFCPSGLMAGRGSLA
jgi:hypothetical protein